MSKILQLKISLNGLKPQIWRRFLVEDIIDFDKLHKIIQKVMGWEDYHLYEFQIDNISISPEEEGFNSAEGMFKQLFDSPEFYEMIEQTKLKNGSANLDVNKLNKIISKKSKKPKNNPFDVNTQIYKLIKSEKQRVYYLYDFGDNWEHSIIVEKIIEKDGSQKYPLCIAGEKACPPEDCGGVYGYEKMLKALKDKNHPEHEHWFEWIGEFDSEEFDIDAINGNLK